MKTLEPLRNPHRVYCAGPLFNEPERREMLDIAGALTTAGFEPFVPHRDGMEFAKVEPYLIRRGHDATAVGQLLHEAIFALDTYQVMVACGALVVNLNGRVPDEGAVAESAMAWTLGKPIVAYKSDARSAISGRDNPLIVGQTGFETVARIEDIPTALAARLAMLRGEPTRQTCPPHIAETLSRGSRLWQALESLPLPRAVADVANAVLAVMAEEQAVAGLPGGGS